MPVKAALRKAEQWFVRLLHLDDSAHSIAMGAAVGVFIAMTPTIGFQMATVIVVTSLLRVNRVAGLPMPWITNPATIVPMYTFSYSVGRWMVGGPGIGEFRRLLTDLASKDLGWSEKLHEWWNITVTCAAPLWVGCLVVGLVSAAATYGAMYYLVTVYRRHHLKVLAERAAREAAEAAAAGREPQNTSDEHTPY